MTKQKIKELKEKLADIEHQRWADWQKYLHSKCSKRNIHDDDKSKYDLVIYQEDVEHWEKQINTDYSELSEKEKDSDREQVERYFPFIQEALKQQREEIKEMIGKIEMLEPYGVIYMGEQGSLNDWKEGFKECVKDILKAIDNLD